MATKLTEEEVAQREAAIDSAIQMMNGVTRETWVRTIAFFLTAVNGVFAMNGGSDLILDVNAFAGHVYAVVSALLLLVTGAWAWWKNNSFSDIARTMDAMKMLMDNGFSLYRAYQSLKGAYAENEKAKKDAQKPESPADEQDGGEDGGE